MASRNPLGKIKDLTKGAASVGMHVAGQATRTATSLTSGVVGKLTGGKKPADGAAAPAPTAPEAPTQAAPEPATPKATAKKPPAKKVPAKKVSTTEPVNVTEELGLDPAPVDQPTATTDKPAAGEPVTAIDAAADTEHVEATPADIAKAVGKKAPARKAPTQKTTPGAKLPPRKKVEKAEQAT